jgi:hypothetical protein
MADDSECERVEASVEPSGTSPGCARSRILTPDSVSPGPIYPLRAESLTKRPANCSGSRDRPVLGHLCTAEPLDSGFELVSRANLSVDGEEEGVVIAGDGLGEEHPHTNSMVSDDLHGARVVQSRPAVRRRRVPVQPPPARVPGAYTHHGVGQGIYAGAPGPRRQQRAKNERKTDAKSNGRV